MKTKLLSYILILLFLFSPLQSVFASEPQPENLVLFPVVILYNQNQEIIDLLPVADESGNLIYIHTDHLNNSSVVTDNSDLTRELSDYFPYGDPRVHQTVNFDDRKGYIGKDYSSDTELSYLEARYLSNERGQFLSQDPVFWEIGQTEDGQKILTNPQAQNSYLYANGNPINNTDPDGRCPICLVGVGYAAMYAPQIMSYAQSLLQPLAQVAISQAQQDAQKGNYGMAVIGAVTAGEFSGVRNATSSARGIVNEIQGARVASNLERTGYNSFAGFKNAAGSAGEGMQWHHIVEQNPVNMSRFEANQIHNVENLISIPKELHQKVTGFYNSKPLGPGTQTIRQIVNQMPFSQQMDFGVKAIKNILKK